ncbi:MAG: hypothetical protein ABR529_06515 [Actinomycetota bacterium]
MTALDAAYERWLYGSLRRDDLAPEHDVAVPADVAVMPLGVERWVTTGRGVQEASGRRWVQVKTTAKWLRPRTELVDEATLPELKALRERQTKVPEREGQK